MTSRLRWLTAEHAVAPRQIGTSSNGVKSLRLNSPFVVIVPVRCFRMPFLRTGNPPAAHEATAWAAIRFVIYHGAAELRREADRWDDLWRRSDATLPTARAFPVAQWVEELGGAVPFHALAIEHDGQLVAAIPLLQARLKRLFPIVRLPWNDWSWAGDLLIDPQCDAAAVERLVELIARETPGLLWFDGVPIDSASWQRLLNCLDARAMHYQRHERFRIGTMDCTQRF